METKDVDQELIAAGLKEEHLRDAKVRAAKERKPLLRVLEEMQNLKIAVLLDAFAKTYQLKVADLSKTEVNQSIVSLIPAELARKFRLIPIDRAGTHVIAATSQPGNSQIEYSVRFATGYHVNLVLASDLQIEQALEKYYARGSVKDVKRSDFENELGPKKAQGGNRIEIGKNNSTSADGPVIKLVNEVLRACIQQRASDIHVEPYENSMRIRLRIDGRLSEIMTVPVEIKDALSSRIKIMSGLDIAEKRLPQDGGIRVKIEERPIDFRVSCLPTIYGEKIVMRILDRSSLQVDMTQLGFEQQDLEKFLHSIHEPHGMVLVTGPTGSGKTTTLYSALSELNKVTDNILTAEDPVEYNLEGINQVQMKPDIGLNFAAALRSFLRQDPDIIMVGEIRDLETSEIAVKAALTGHLVLSTLHTNSAPETITRILNMGVEPFNIAAALNCIVAQRLARKICPDCRGEDELVNREALIELGIHPQHAGRFKAYRGQGCKNCNGTGNRGRVAIHEVLVVDESIKEAILANASAIELKKIAVSSGMRTLRQVALQKMVQGIVSAQEVVRVTAADVVGTSSKKGAA